MCNVACGVVGLFCKGQGQGMKKFAIAGPVTNGNSPPPAQTSGAPVSFTYPAGGTVPLNNSGAGAPAGK
jgi:hypothetical protein